MKMAVTVAVVGLDCGRRITGPRYSSTICPAAAGTFSWAPVLLSGCLHRVFSKEERQASYCLLSFPQGFLHLRCLLPPSPEVFITRVALHVVQEIGC